MWKISIQYLVPGFELTNFGTWVSSHNHYTRAPALLKMVAKRQKQTKKPWWKISTYNFHCIQIDLSVRFRSQNIPRTRRMYFWRLTNHSILFSAVLADSNSVSSGITRDISNFWSVSTMEVVWDANIVCKLKCFFVLFFVGCPISRCLSTTPHPMNRVRG